MKNKLPSLSVFFPCYNEEKNLPGLIDQAVKILPQVAKKYEIVVINDGSTDATQQVAQELAAHTNYLKIVNHPTNRGYGAALRTGFQACRYQWIFFTDADLQFNLQELTKFIKYTDQYQVVIGWRRKRADGQFRALNARLFKLYIDLLFRLHVKDIDCAFKLIDQQLIQSVPLFSEGAFVSSELLYKLKKRGIKFKQLPVNHYPRQHGQPTGNKLPVVIRGLVEAFQLYLQIKFGGR